MTNDLNRFWRNLAYSTVMMSMLAEPAGAAPPVFEIEIRNHLFHPDIVTIPAGIKVKLVVHNQDATPEEFESFELNREKVVMGGTRATIFIGPLAPGEYAFLGEFNPNTAVGKIIAVEAQNAD